MSVLGRVRWTPNERLDLPDISAIDSYSVTDWQALMSAMVGYTNPFIITGFELFDPASLINTLAPEVSVVVDGSILWWAAGSSGSFWQSVSGATNIIVPLISDNTGNNLPIYIEMDLEILATAEDLREVWDPGANAGVGGEIPTVVDTENYLNVKITRNNTGFTTGKVPIAVVIINNNQIITIEDRRPLMFRLGRGGPSPDNNYQYPWPDTPVGYSRTDVPSVMTSQSSPNVFKGSDKNITNFKDWMDAVMSRLAEIDGGSSWFTSTMASPSGASISLQSLYLDSDQGHYAQAAENVSWSWSKHADNKLRIENTYIAKTVGGETAKWRLNYGAAQVTWELGGDFVVGSNRLYVDPSLWTEPNSILVTNAINDGQNLYLRMQRDAIINSNPTVTWTDTSGITPNTAKVESTATSPFAGIAVGDYIRKESDSTLYYYKVIELQTTYGNTFPNGTVTGYTANGTVKCLIIQTASPILSSSETYRYFRSRYAKSDLVISATGFLDNSYYWIGRCVGNLSAPLELPRFTLRHYGMLSVGEEAEHSDDSGVGNDGGSSGTSGVAEIMLDHHPLAVFNSSLSGGSYGLNGAYYTSITYPTTLLTIRRRMSVNTIETPTPSSDNSNAILTYTIQANAPAGITGLSNGDQLWVRLLDSAGGLISAGSVTNIDPPQNVYEVRNVASAPLRDFDNKDVVLLAWVHPVVDPEGNTDHVLQFIDGTMLSLTGNTFNQSVNIKGDLEARGNISIGSGAECTSVSIGQGSAAKIINIANPADTANINTNLKEFIQYTNNTGAIILRKSIVALDVTHGTIKKSIADSFTDVQGTIGIVSADIGIGLSGLVQVLGEAEVFTTTNLTIGQVAYISSSIPGYATPTSPDIPGTAVCQIGIATAINKVQINIQQVSSVSTAYEEVLNVISGAPANDHQITGPVVTTSNIGLPSNSRNGNTAQTYQVGGGNLELFLNGQRLNLGIDWIEVGALHSYSGTVEILLQLEINDSLTFHICSAGAVLVSSGGGGGGGGSGDLQGAYNNGETINVISGQPMTLVGTGKVLSITGDTYLTGDIIITGVIL